MRRKTLGAYVRSFEVARAQAFAHAEQELAGVEPFRLHALLAQVTPHDLAARQRELFGEDAIAVATLVPGANES